MSKIDPDILAYEGCDLEAMASADNYYSWLISIIRPYLGDHVVEVGAGSGSFSQHLLKVNPKKFTVIEPTKNMFVKLRATIKGKASKKTSLVAHNAFMGDIQKKIAAEKPDSFVYINVFEHIEDDLGELKMLKRTVNKDGHIVVFVPALQALFSEFDERIGHYRRYTKKSLTKLAQEADLEIVTVRYMDIVGIAPWWIRFVVMKRKNMTPGLVGFYDKFVMPIIRSVESVVPMPVGKNVLLIARKK